MKNLTNTVEIIKVTPFYLKDLPEITAYLDTGYSLEETKNIITRMYPDVDFSTKQLAIILLKKLDESQKTQVEHLIGSPILFSHDWNNKLQCRCFTTIRINQPEKYIVGNYHDLLLSMKSTKSV